MEYRKSEKRAGSYFVFGRETNKVKMNNEEVIQKFYTSFQNGNAKGMSECYADEIIFHDPAFGELRGEKAKKMWEMLLERSKGELKIEFSDVVADEKTGSANWVAKYNFAQTGRNVVNKIHANFQFMDGKIIMHNDHFSLWKWSRQALGWKGWLLGGTEFMRGKIQKQTNELLLKHMQK
jgi:ketosteroid isomerase-like protein